MTCLYSKDKDDDIDMEDKDYISRRAKRYRRDCCGRRGCILLFKRTCGRFTGFLRVCRRRHRSFLDLHKVEVDDAEEARVSLGVEITDLERRRDNLLREIGALERSSEAKLLKTRGDPNLRNEDGGEEPAGRQSHLIQRKS